MKQSLVNYSMGTAPDIAAIPEDIAAAITPAAAVQAVYAIRQQRKEEHRHLMMASAESDALRAQVSGEDNAWAGCLFFVLVPFRNVLIQHICVVANTAAGMGIAAGRSRPLAVQDGECLERRGTWEV